MSKMCLGGGAQTHLGAAHIHDFGSMFWAWNGYLVSITSPNCAIIWVQRVYGHHPSFFLGGGEKKMNHAKSRQGGGGGKKKCWVGI
jgi:hypothetical protein